jgi:hypothetical protein
MVPNTPPSDPHTRFLETALRDGQPDWNAITFDVLCSRCGYNLKLLPQPRCPECGLEFKWQEMLNRAALRSDFLFEHQWRVKPIRSWLATLWRSLFPRRFWGQVSAYDRIHSGPIGFMLTFSAVPALIVLHATAGLGWMILHGLDLGWFIGLRGGGTLSPPYFVYAERFLHSVLVLPLESPFQYWSCVLSATLAMFALLPLLACWSAVARGCQDRWGPIVRLVTYTANPVLILWSIWILICFCWFETSRLRNELLDLGLLVTPLLIVFIMYLGIGLKHYLRLPHPWITAAASVLASLLIAFGAVSVCVRLAMMCG